MLSAEATHFFCPIKELMSVEVVILKSKSEEPTPMPFGTSPRALDLSGQC